jgi:hypothetical protein
MSVWIIDLLVICFNPHPEALACPFTLKVLQAKERIPTLFSVVFTFRLTFESYEEYGGVSLVLIYKFKKNHPWSGHG